MISDVRLGDCMDFMREFPDGFFELAIVDPPYGIGEDGSKNHTRSKIAKSRNYKSFAGNDTKAPDITYFKELFRVSKNQIIWGANHFLGLTSPCWIVWDKDNGLNDFADCELAWTSFDTAVRRFKFKWHGMLQQDMKNKELRIHPTQKPIALYKWLLKNYAKPGDKILDTHLGSGSSRIAAHDMGFDFYATELDPDYFAAQEERFQRHIKQGQLFVPEQQYGQQISLLDNHEA